LTFAQNSTDELKLSVPILNKLDSLSSITDSLMAPNSQKVDQIIGYAKKYLGTPYRSSGMTPSGFDCSGFIFYIMGNYGMSLTHSSYGMAEYGKTVKLSEIRPGDLMFFKGSNSKSSRIGHVGMVVEVTPDAIKFIHSSTSRGVIIDNFKSSKYYVPRYVTTKRLDFGVSATEEKTK
jgi:cell wall-associated NlpC family hydrolase